MRDSTESQRANRSVLIVEDDETLASLLELYLKREDFRVAVARTCAAAQRALEAESRDLILLDLNLPDGDGLDVLRWVRERDDRTVVIVLTSFRQEEKGTLAFDLGAADFVSKPFRPRELLARVRHTMRRAHPA